MGEPATTVAGWRVCPRCGAGFVCASAAGVSACWCADLPLLLSVPEAGAACYCPDCLRAIVAQQESTGMPRA